MRPLVTSSMPAISFSSVDLPQPDGPTRTRNSPSRTSSETSSTAWAPPLLYALLTASMRMLTFVLLHALDRQPVLAGSPGDHPAPRRPPARPGRAGRAPAGPRPARAPRTPRAGRPAAPRPA